MDIGVHTVVYGLAFACAFLTFQLIISLGRQATIGVKHVNDRLKQMDTNDAHEDVLKKIRENRGLDAEGNIKGLIKWIDKLVLHSGLKLGKSGIYAIIIGSTMFLSGAFFIWKPFLVWAGIGSVLGLVLPIFVLKLLVKRRRSKAVTQLPEALDIIVRSLSAGHPVPVAMSLVGREMPDPIGSEFGIASDEIAFGSNLSHAIQRLADRVGHDDFELFAAMIRLQERTGGNLAELLRANASTIRDRQKMRLKIKAASGEGRASAMILNAAPIGLFVIINVMDPTFFGDVKDEKLVRYGFAGIAVWMVIGNLIMRRMINFRI